MFILPANTLLRAWSERHFIQDSFTFTPGNAGYQIPGYLHSHNEKADGNMFLRKNLLHLFHYLIVIK